MQLGGDHGCVWAISIKFFWEERRRGLPRGQAYLDQFQPTLEDCDLMDLGFVIDPFTWCNNSHTSENYVHERLDRAMENGGWHTKFPLFKVINGDPHH